MKAQTPTQFFFEHAGHSYDPKTESKTQGRKRCARALARAERQALELGYSFEWLIDSDVDSSDFSCSKPAWNLWGCICRNSCGESVESLWGIDFGRNGNPWSAPYRRVVEAELALEALPDAV